MTGRIRSGRGIALAAMLAGAPAAAQVDLSACTVDPASPEAARFATYDAGPYGDDAMVYFGQDPAGATSYAVIESCPARQALMVSWPSTSVTLGAGVVDVFTAMLFAEENYTVSDVGAQMREMGARTDFATLDYESCACAALAAEGTAP